MRVKKLPAVLALAFISFAALAAEKAASQPEKVSKLFEYSGYTSEEYKSYKKISAYVPMSDGVKLAVDVFIPADGPDKKSFPVVIEYTPYTRAYLDLKNGPLHKTVRKALLKSDDPVVDVMAGAKAGMGKILSTLVATGYVFIRADMRGSGASTGWKADFMPQLAKDGGELLDWVAAQPWCDGNIGMLGGSYTGYSQLITAGQGRKALKCIAPMMVPLDGYDGEVYPGGIYMQEFMEAYSEGLTRMNLNYYSLPIGKMLLGKGEPALPAAPVIDEDNDGQLIDEVPIDKNRNGTFLDDYMYPFDPDDEPRYKDRQTRKHIYYLATKDHEQNIDYHNWAHSMYFIDAEPPYPFQQFTSYDFSPSAHLPAIMKSGIPVYNIGGWFDPFTRGTIELFCTMQKTNPSRMLIVPGFHGGGGPYWKYLGEDPKSLMKKAPAELLRFFDRYLKGIDNGIDKDPPIHIYVMNGGGWRAENEWPLARQVITSYFFSEDHGLKPGAAQPGADKYVADFSHDSRYGRSKGNRWLSTMGLAPDALPVRTQKDKQCLTYTSAPLEKDTEVTGHPIAEFWVSSTADYGDFFVYLEDVDEKGTVVLVSEGLLNSGFAGLVSNDEEILSGASGVNVLPELPWHGFEKAQFKDEIFKGGKIVKLVLDLKPSSWVFRKGHSIRVAIAAADWPTFRLNPRLAWDNNPKNPANIVPVITVHRDADHPSRIELPVIPK